MYNIIKMDPYKTSCFPQLVNIIKSIGAEISQETNKAFEMTMPSDTDGLTREELYKCKNSLYIAVKDCPNCNNTQDCIHSICAAIGLTKTTTKDTDIPELPYHCQDNLFVYKIRFFVYNKDTDIEVLKELVGGVLNDRNDAFIVYETYSIDIDIVEEVFKYNGFDVVNEKYTIICIKAPTSATKKETELE